MFGIWVAVNPTTSKAGLSRKQRLKLWKSRPAAPMITTRRAPIQLLPGKKQRSNRKFRPLLRIPYVEGRSRELPHYNRGVWIVKVRVTGRPECAPLLRGCADGARRLRRTLRLRHGDGMPSGRQDRRRLRQDGRTPVAGAPPPGARVLPDQDGAQRHGGDVQAPEHAPAGGGVGRDRGSDLDRLPSPGLPAGAAEGN